MHDGVYVRSFLINSHVHLDFGGGVESALDLVALTVNADYHVRGHVTLGHACRSAVEFVGTDLDGNITVVGCYETVIVNTLADVADFLFDFK
ncbi:unknown [Clostridium sp. CAG:448]|nr:unknown [Clostridium sp. CAG:448]